VGDVDPKGKSSVFGFNRDKKNSLEKIGKTYRDVKTREKMVTSQLVTLEDSLAKDVSKDIYSLKIDV